MKLQDSGSRFRAGGPRIYSFRFRAQDLGFRGLDSGFGFVWGLGSRV